MIFTHLYVCYISVCYDMKIHTKFIDKEYIFQPKTNKFTRGFDNSYEIRLVLEILIIFKVML